MRFDSEASEIYYNAEENDDSHLSTTQNKDLNDEDRADLYAENSLATKNGQPNEVDADKELERALMDRLEGNDT